MSIHLKQYPDTRPKTRGECADMPRPCPFLSCRYHLGHRLLLESSVTQEEAIELVERYGAKFRAARSVNMGSTKFNKVLAGIDEDTIAERVASMKHSCTLDVADVGEHGARDIAKINETTRDAVNSVQQHMRQRVTLEGEAVDWAEQVASLGNVEPFDEFAPDPHCRK